MSKLVDVTIVNRSCIPEIPIFYMILKDRSRFDAGTADRAGAVGRGRGGVTPSPGTRELGFRAKDLHVSRRKASADFQTLNPRTFQLVKF